MPQTERKHQEKRNEKRKEEYQAQRRTFIKVEWNFAPNFSPKARLASIRFTKFDNRYESYICFNPASLLWFRLILPSKILKVNALHKCV